MWLGLNTEREVNHAILAIREVKRPSSMSCVLKESYSEMEAPCPGLAFAQYCSPADRSCHKLFYRAVHTRTYDQPLFFTGCMS